jgi:hypothetical protein
MDMLRIPGNPYDPRWLPFTHKTRLVHDTIHSTGFLVQAALQRAEDLADALNSMTQPERDIMGQAQREGVAPTALLRAHPELEALYKSEAGAHTTLENLDHYWEREGETFRHFWQLLRASGRISEHEMRNFERTGLDPRGYHAFGVQEFATSTRARRAVGQEPALGPHPELGALAMDWGEMEFRREPGKFRVRVVEPTKVVNKFFDTKNALNDWMDQTYGKQAWKGIGKVAEGKQNGRTIYNEPITVGHPLTEAEREANGEIFGRTPEMRLQSLKAGLQDAYLNLLTESLNHFGGLVLDDKDYLGFVGSNANLKSQYVKISDSVRSFGPLAGKYVHRKILAHLEQASKTFESIHGLLRGYQQSLENPAEAAGLGEALGAGAKRLLSEGGSWLNRFVKSNVILKSAPTWVLNHIFNRISSYLSGASRAMSLEGLGMQWEQIVEKRPGGKGKLLSAVGLESEAPRTPASPKSELAWLRLREPYLQEAREYGLIGGMFESDSEAFRDMNRRVFGVDPADAPRVKQLLTERQGIYERLRDERLKAGGGETAVLSRLEGELAVRQDALREAERSWHQRVGLRLSNIWLEMGTRDLVGRPRSQWWHDMRRWYNHMDDYSKLLQFADLREQGIPAPLAASRIRLFNQDYVNLPRWVRFLNKSPLGSLVVSFPHELARIAKNAALHEPAKFVGVLGMLPFLNMLQFAQAGIGWDRALAMAEARGQKGRIRGALSMFSTLYLTDPTSRAVTSTMDFGNVLPYVGLFQTRGALARMFDAVVPEEQRSTWEEVAGLGVGVASNFVGSNPIFNGITYLTAGADPQTGEPLTDKAMPWPKRLQTTMKLMAGDILPPQLPLGRDFMAWWRAGQAGVSPKTGRLQRADEQVTSILRGLTRVTVRGTAAEKIGAVLGLGTRAKDPTIVDDNDLIMTTTYRAMNELPRLGVGQDQVAKYGEYNELRDYLLRSVDTSLTEKQREQAKRDAQALSHEMHRYDIGGVSGAMPMASDREMRLFSAKVVKGGVADFFATQPIQVQGMALALLDQYQLPDDRMKELVWHIEHSETNALRWPRDPQMVQFAIDQIDTRLKAPDHSPHLDRLRARLDVMLKYAEAHDKMDQFREPIMEKKKDLIQRAVGK